MDQLTYETAVVIMCLRGMEEPLGRDYLETYSIEPKSIQKVLWFGLEVAQAKSLV